MAVYLSILIHFLRKTARKLSPDSPGRHYVIPKYTAGVLYFLGDSRKILAECASVELAKAFADSLYRNCDRQDILFDTFYRDTSTLDPGTRASLAESGIVLVADIFANLGPDMSIPIVRSMKEALKSA